MNWKQILLLLILAGGGLLVMSLGDADPARVEFVPDHLHGQWQTRDASYAGRYVEFGPQRIVFGVRSEG